MSRAPRLASVASRSALTGTAISAAPVGVGARTSAARSISVQSVSWPTAEITGMREAATARARPSSLKPQRSSRLPPPRATISRSGCAIAPSHASALKPLTAAVTSAPAVSPCTLTGQTSTCSGKRSLMRWMMSRITDPVGEVTTPMVRGMNGRLPLAAGIEQAFGLQPALAFFQQRHQRAGAGRLEIVDDDLVVGFAGIGGELAGGDHLHPFLGAEFQPAHRAFPHHRVEPGAVVLQREIGMAGRVRTAIARYLAAHPHIAEDVLDGALQRA